MTAGLAIDSLLDLVDRTINDWEARPESWLPGDPLYRDPRGEWTGEQTVRPMIQLVELDASSNTAYQPAARCEDCQVAWKGQEPCWVCGTEREEPPTLASVLDAWLIDLLTERFRSFMVGRRAPAPRLSEETVASLENFGVQLHDWQQQWLAAVWAHRQDPEARPVTAVQPRRHQQSPFIGWISAEDITDGTSAEHLTLLDEVPDLTDALAAWRYQLTEWSQGVPRVRVPGAAPLRSLPIAGDAYARRRAARRRRRR